MYVCRCVCVHPCKYECIHLGMYAVRHESVCISVHMYACVKSLLPCQCTHIWCHWTHMAATLQISSTQPLWYMGIWTQYFCICMPKHNQLSTAISTWNSIAMYWPATNMSHNMPYIPNMPMCTYNTNVSINTTYELAAINNVIRSTDIHTFHITGICPCTNMYLTSHICPTALLL